MPDAKIFNVPGGYAKVHDVSEFAIGIGRDSADSPATGVIISFDNMCFHLTFKDYAHFKTLLHTFEERERHKFPS